MKRKLVLLTLCAAVAAAPITAFADEKDDRIAELEAQYNQLMEDYETLQSEYDELSALVDSLLSEESETENVDAEGIGQGEIIIRTSGGSSEDGNVPVLYIEPDAVLVDIGFEAWDFDGSLLSYIYIDGELNTKEQLGDTQTSISLTDDALKVGKHDVEVYQYTDNDENGEVVTYKTASYEIVES